MRQLLRQRAGDEQRATFLELFFDLVFVFAVTQISHALLAHLTPAGAARALFLLLVVWWAWIYTTWMTNWFDPDAPAVRGVLFGGMLASLLMAVAIPDAFGDRALLFALGYVGLQQVRNAFIVLATRSGEGLHRAFVRIWAWNSWVGVIWVAGALLPHDARIGVWLVALVLDYAGPAAGYWTPRIGRSKTSDWEIEHAHFAERFQLFVIIALGESIVVTGAAGTDLGLTPARTVAIVVALLGTMALWWLYFDEVAERSAEDLARAPDQGRLSRDAFTCAHVPIVAGIIVSAVGDEVVIAHPGATLHAAEVLALVGGPALYLLGHVAFRLRMVGTLSVERVMAIGALLLAGLAGTSVPALALGIAVVVVLALLALAETRGRARLTAAAPVPPVVGPEAETP